LERLQQVVIVGHRDAADTQAMIIAAFSVSAPDRLVSVIAPDAKLPASHPAHGKRAIDGKATAYVCVGPVCGAPVTEADALKGALKQGNREHS
jgi:hypothetical protein